MHAPTRTRAVSLLALVTFAASLAAPPFAEAQRRGGPLGRPGGGAAQEADEGDGEDGGDDGDGQRARAATGGVTRRTGFELELHGTAGAYADRPVALRGVAYEVIGLATLRPLPRARVVVIDASRADAEQQPLQEVTADAQGRFALAFNPVPSIAILVGTGRNARRFEVALDVRAPQRIEMLTDRRRYEPGESIHVWVRLTDAASGAPVADRPVEISVGGAGARATRLGLSTVRTSRGGVATLVVPVPAGAPDGVVPVSAVVQDAWHARAQAAVQIGRRTVERLMADVRLDQAVVAPSARVTGRVVVRTPSGAPVRGARVEIRVPGVAQPVVLETDGQGTAPFSVTAPAYLSEAVAPQTLDVRVLHRAHGSLRTAATFTLARAPYAIEAVAAGGALVPEALSHVFLTLADPQGLPPPAGTAVTVAGAGVANGSFRGTTDPHGVVMVPMRPPRGAAAMHSDGRCAGSVATSFDVTVESAVPVSARQCARVATEAQVAVRVARPVVAPGARVELSVERRPAARARPVVVDLIHRDDRSGRLSVLASQILAAGDARATLALPAGFVGVVFARARPVGGEGVAEGTGASDVVLVRPAQAFRLELAAGQPRYLVRQTARVIARTPAGLQGGRVALVARDLAAHAGELPFALAWLQGAVSSAVSNPATPDAERLVRAALAAFASADPTAVRASPLVRTVSGDEDEGDGEGYNADGAMERGDLRDPFARRDELLRRGIGAAMRAIEEAVERATEDDSVRGVITRGAGRRGFDPTVVHTLGQDGNLEGEAAETLGGGALTVAMLQAADPGFTFDRVARRVARRRLVRLLASLAGFVDAGEGGRSGAGNEPPDRWLSRMVQRGVISAGALRDPWGGTFALRRVAPGREAVAIGVRAAGWELSSPGPDRAPGTADDVRNPFERVVPEGTVYAVAAGEDALMGQLAALDPGAEVLAQVSAAYQRVAAGADEESTGDVVGAEESEAIGGIGLAGAGAGGGGEGQGYGAGVGRLGGIGTRGAAARGRFAANADMDGVMDQEDAPVQAAAPEAARRPMAQTVMREMANERRQRAGQGRPDDAGGPRTAQLAALVRERFPATLRVIAEAPIDPSGETALEFPVADALTTYRVDAIAWTDDGWTTSASTNLRVDQDAVVDAPVPPYAVVGDAVRLPLRVSNRSDHPIRVRANVAAEGDLQVDVQGGGEVTIEPGDAREVVVTVTPRRPGRGALVVTAVDAASGAAFDAARRPMEALPDARPVRMAAEALADGQARLVLEVPRDATYRADGQVRVTVGAAIFGDPRAWGERAPDPTWPAWALALGGEPAPAPLLLRVGAPFSQRGVEPDAYGLDAAAIARGVSSLWGSVDVPDETITRGLAALTRAMEGYERLPRAVLTAGGARAAYGRQHADVLLGLAPAFQSAARRPGIAAQLRAVVSRLRRSVESNTAASGDAPEDYARAAASLALTRDPRAQDARAAEFLRRATRGVVRVGDDVSLEVGGDPVARVVPSVHYALAQLGSGDRAAAFAVARTLARSARGANRWSLEARAMASGLVGRLTTAAGAPRGAVRIVVDGRPAEVALANGVATHAARALSEPGRHTIEVILPAGVALVVQAEARYGRPWTAQPAARGPLAVTLDGAIGARDGRSALVLRVQNRGPRVVPAPVIEVDVPAGAELDEDARAAIGRRTASPATLTGRTLVLPLRALAPGGFVRVPIALRWSVAGRLRGLGVAAYGSDEAGAGATVVPSRQVDVPDAGEEPEPPAAARGAQGGAP